MYKCVKVRNCSLTLAEDSSGCGGGRLGGGSVCVSVSGGAYVRAWLIPATRHGAEYIPVNKKGPDHTDVE